MFLESPLFYALYRHGFRPLFKERLRIFTPEALTAVLFAELFVLGLLKKYPFTGDRITLFLAPLVIFGIVRTFSGLKRWKFPYYLFLTSHVALLSASCIYPFYLYWGLY